MGQISAECLPSRELWLLRTCTLPEFTHLPQRFNSTERLLDKTVAVRKGRP